MTSARQNLANTIARTSQGRVLLTIGLRRHVVVLPDQLCNGGVRGPHGHPAPGGRGLPSERRAPRRQGAIPGPEVPLSEAGLHAPCRGGHSAGRHGDDALADENPAGGYGSRGHHVVCGEGEAVAAAGAVQGQGGVYQRPDYQVEAEEDQVKIHR